MTRRPAPPPKPSTIDLRCVMCDRTWTLTLTGPRPEPSICPHCHYGHGITRRT
jgi:hypothetical protein